VLTTLIGIDGYATVLEAVAPRLRANADAVDDGGDPHPLRKDLAVLRAQITQKGTQIAATKSGLAAFAYAVSDDVIRFSELAEQIPTTYGPDLTRLRTELGQLRARMEANNDIITGAAASLWPSMAVLGLAAGVAVLYIDEAKVIVERGYEMAKGATDAVDAAMADSQDAIRTYKATLTALTQEVAELGIFATVTGNVERLGRTTSDTLNALDALSQGWSDEENYLVWLAALTQSPSPSGVRAAIDTMTTRWADTEAATQALVATLLHLDIAT
jgi:hypothetical protein